MKQTNEQIVVNGDEEMHSHDQQVDVLGEHPLARVMLLLGQCLCHLVAFRGLLIRSSLSRHALCSIKKCITYGRSAGLDRRQRSVNLMSHLTGDPLLHRLDEMGRCLQKHHP